MLTGQGTAREQWAEAGIEVALGRMTAAELHALGMQVFELRREERERVRELKALASEWEEKADGLESDLEDMKDENKALKKRITELEANQR